jgi:ABC-type amino acid transport substrate-binding protein
MLPVLQSIDRPLLACSVQLDIPIAVGEQHAHPRTRFRRTAIAMNSKSDGRYEQNQEVWPHCSEKQLRSVKTCQSPTHDRLPYRDEVIALFTTSPNVEPGDIQSFSDITKHGLHLVAPLAGYYGQEFAISEGELQRKGALTRVEGDEKMVNMLIQGHGELIMGDEMVIPHVAKIMNLQNFHRVELEANRDMVYIGLSKASTTEQDQKALNSAIAKLLANGRIAAVIRHYREADR